LPSEATLALVGQPPSSRASSLTLVPGGVPGGVVASPGVDASSGAGVPDGSGGGGDGGGGADPVAPIVPSFTREAIPVPVPPVPSPVAGLSTLEWAGIVAGVGALAAGVYFLTR
jgi:hypothetical protein